MSVSSNVRGRGFLLALLGALSLCVAIAAVAPSIVDAKRIAGTQGADNIKGTKRADLIRLKGGDDVGIGKGGNDKIFGANGKDRLNGNRGMDRLYGGNGRDRLVAVDGRRDRRVNAGTGLNRCRVDDADVPVVSGCSRFKAVDPGSGSGGGGDPEGPGQRLEVDSAQGLTCDDASLVCNYQLSGGGADEPVGTVTAGGGVTLNAGGGANALNGEWTAVGAYRCTSDGFLRITFAAEDVTVPVDCV